MRINPVIGSMRIADVRSGHAQQVIDRAIEAGLSPSSIRQIRAILHGAFKWAMRQRPPLVAFNPVDAVDVPALETRKLMTLLPPGHPLLGTINYEQAVAHLLGPMTSEEAQADMTIQTAQFSKRQRTWFKKEAWLRPVPSTDSAPILDEVRAFLGR